MIHYIQGDYSCLTCDSSDGTICATCDTTTRKLLNGQCICKDGFMEITSLKSPQCLQCSENCITCDISKRNYCLSCGDESITFRQLINNDCVCKTGYQVVPYQYACEVDTWDERLLTFKFKTDTSRQYWKVVANLFVSKDMVILKEDFFRGYIQNIELIYSLTNQRNYSYYTAQKLVKTQCQHFTLYFVMNSLLSKIIKIYKHFHKYTLQHQLNHINFIYFIYQCQKSCCQRAIQRLFFNYNNVVVTELTTLIQNSYLQDTAVSSVQKYYFNLVTNQKQFFFNKDVLPIGQYYQQFDQNVFAVGYIQPKDIQSVLWKFGSTGLAGSTSYYYTSRLLEKQWNAGMFQYLKDQAVYVQAILTQEQVTGSGTRRRFLAEDYSIYQVMYFFYIGYTKSTFLSDGECEILMDGLMNLINGCQKYCDDCYFYQNLEKCNSCQLNRVNQNGNCQCKYETTDQSQCYEPCKGLDCITCADGVCITCPDGSLPPCNNPSIKCDEGYYNENQQCLKCTSPCVTCTSKDVCTKCLDTYYIKQQDAQFICQSCEAPCVNCSTLNDCNSCKDEFYIKDKSCLSCTFENKQLIYRSIPYCFKCNVENYCVTCITGKYSNDLGQCVNCPSICTSCTASNNCQSCIEGYYNSIGYCNKCQSQCSKCLNSSQCTQCIPGYYLNNYQCIKCDNQCVTCFGQSNYCTSCISSQTLINNKCIQCESPCVMCQNSSTQCLSCEETTYIAIDNKCLPCQQGCKQCKVFNDYCQSCQQGYYLDNNTCLKCNWHCESCINENNCQSCVKGYYLKDQNCLPCPIECSDDCQFQSNQIVCNSCSSTYFKNSNICEQCQEPCLKCSTSKTNCLDCITGYYLSSNVCSSCTLTQCKVCQNLTQCAFCNDGYLLNESNICEQDTLPCQAGFVKVKKTDQCLPCNNTCLTCYGLELYQCKTCNDGYFLDIKDQCKQCRYNLIMNPIYIHVKHVKIMNKLVLAVKMVFILIKMNAYYARQVVMFVQIKLIVLIVQLDIIWIILHV